MPFKEKVFKVVSQIPEGFFLTYKDVAKLAEEEKAWRAVGNILAKNRNKNIPCHRVVRSDNLIGGYLGKESLSFKKLALLLKEGVLAVLPTDTIYGICTTALKEKAVKKIYEVRKREKGKPMIVLISDIKDLDIFGVKIGREHREILNKIWPGKITVVFKVKDKKKREKFKYLLSKEKTIALRLPKSSFLRKILKISGPLVAPSANLAGKKPATNIKEAKKYFGKKVVYFDGGDIRGEPSTLIAIQHDKIDILRKGSELKKVLKILDPEN